MAATGRMFDCQFPETCFVEDGKIECVRDPWNAPDMPILLSHQGQVVISA